MAITNIFPTPIYQSHIITNIDHTNYQYYDCGNGHISYSTNILNNYPQLQQQIQQHLDSYTTQLGYTTNTQITTSWLNLHKQHGYCQLHNHSNSIISGVVFINIPSNSGKFLFKRNNSSNDKLFSMQIQMDTTEQSTQYTGNEYIIDPQPNTLLLFPSHLQHMVTPNNSTQERLTLAFNVIPHGLIGQNLQNSIEFRNSTP
jgi:uncharacterized protein (TIGR02466 family)